MPRVRTIALPHRYANLPTWFFVVNAFSILIGWTLAGLIAANPGVGSIFLMILAWMVFVAHFLLVALPSFNRVLFAQQVSPLQRLIGLGLTGAGLAGTFLAAFGVWW